MNRCFFHNEILAVTKCTSCHRPLCEECAKKTEVGIVCGDECHKRMKQFFERYPDGKINKLKKLSFFRYRLSLFWEVIIVILGIYIFMYIKYNYTNPVDMLNKILEWIENIF